MLHALFTAKPEDKAAWTSGDGPTCRGIMVYNFSDQGKKEILFHPWQNCVDKTIGLIIVDAGQLLTLKWTCYQDI